MLDRAIGRKGDATFLPLPMKWLGRLYGRRIINVNCNVILAGTLALLPTLWIVSLTRTLWGGIHNKFAITAITFVSDLVFDVVIYYILHWLANHLPRRWGVVGSHAYQHLSFIRDATLVQFERMLMAPVLYTVALGLQNYLMHDGVSREWATVWGFAIGVCITRTMHTFWMLRAEGRAKKRNADFRSEEFTTEAQRESKVEHPASSTAP